MIIAQTPLRISFAGGGTDLREFYAQEEGCVVSSSINKYLFVIVTRRFDRRIYINYSRKEIVDTVGEIQHDLVREAMRLTGVREGVEITTLADVPSEGIGLGSSSSLTVGLLNALYAFRGEQVPAERLAREACEIEIAILGRPIGKQDQYIAAYGGLRCITFRPNEQVEVEPIPLPGEALRRLSQSLLLFYTNSTRSATPILEEQRRNTDGKRHHLRALRGLARELRGRLRVGDLEALGPILHEGWMHKRCLATPISTPALDEMYERAVKAGAMGGKICGAGGGGFLLLFCPPALQDKIRCSLRGFRELPFALSRGGSRIIFHIRRGEDE